MTYLFLSPLEAHLECPYLYVQRSQVHHAKDAYEVAVRPCPFPGVRKNVLDLLESGHHAGGDPGGGLTMILKKVTNTRRIVLTVLINI